MEYQNQVHQLSENNQLTAFSNVAEPSSTCQKSSMWTNAQYNTDSAYSTQAPSISSIDAFLNQEEATYHNMENLPSVNIPQQVHINTHPQSSAEWDAHHPQSNSTTIQTSYPANTLPPQASNEVSSNWNYQQSSSQQSQQNYSTENNAVANWMNYQDNSEMAIKAIPELLKLLVDEDLLVVQQAAILLNQMSKNEIPRTALIQVENAVECLVNCLNTTADLETARSLVGALYGVSCQRPTGVQAVVNSKALQPLVKMLSAPLETIVSYSITTLHNVLLSCGDKIKNYLRKIGAIHNMIPLLCHNKNVKFLSVLIDCLQMLAFGNQEAKQIILEQGGTQILISLLSSEIPYQKLILHTIRLLKVLSVCPHNKAVMINGNSLQTLGTYLIVDRNPETENISYYIQQNCLITIRNLSDLASELTGLDSLVQKLLELLTFSDLNTVTLVSGILSNLTCNNERNKRTLIKLKGVNIVLKVIQNNSNTSRPQLIEPCLCILKHIINRNSEAYVATEQFKSFNGFDSLIQIMTLHPKSWICLKATLGVLRNLCQNQSNLSHFRSNTMIEKLMQILFEAYNEVLRLRSDRDSSFENKVDGVNMIDIIELCSLCLLIISKDYEIQVMMKDLDCIVFFVQMFFSSIASIQRCALNILVELTLNKECAVLIDSQAGLHQYIQINFYNQYGALKSPSEMNSDNTSLNSSILNNVSVLVQRLNENKNISPLQNRPSFATAYDQSVRHNNNQNQYFEIASINETNHIASNQAQSNHQHFSNTNYQNIYSHQLQNDSFQQQYLNNLQQYY